MLKEIDLEFWPCSNLPTIPIQKTSVIFERLVLNPGLGIHILKESLRQRFGRAGSLMRLVQKIDSELPKPKLLLVSIQGLMSEERVQLVRVRIEHTPGVLGIGTGES